MKTLVVAPLFLIVAFGACTTVTTSREPVPSPQLLADVTALANSPEISAAYEFVEQHREEILREWRTLSEIAAPSGAEQKRARHVESLLRGFGLDVATDAEGNVIAVRKGTAGGSMTVFDAHLDTVFSAATDLTTSVRDGRLHGPGVGDDTRNVEALLASIRALAAAGIETRGDLVFVFTVREETDFGGVKRFLEDHKDSITQYVALDGGFRGFTYGGIGTYWYRYHILGPGGHTRSSTPPYSATLPLSRAISRIYRLNLPGNPQAFANVGMLQGSEVVNAKASDAWFSLDLRSTSASDLDELDRKIRKIVQSEAARYGMTMRQEVISREPVATLPGNRTSPLVMTADAVFRVSGIENPPITDTASNHSSAAIRAGISAISTGAGPCSGAHSLEESCAIAPIYDGIKRIILLEVALAR